MRDLLRARARADRRRASAPRRHRRCAAAAVSGVPKAQAAPAPRASSDHRARRSTSAPAESRFSRSSICRSSVGEVIAAGEMRRPAPCRASSRASICRCSAPRKGVPGRRSCPCVARRLRAVGIVERHDRGFGEHVGRAEARRMARVAFDLDRPSVDRGRQHAAAVAGERQRGGEIQRLARHQAFRHVDIRDDLLVRLAAGGERQRQAAVPSSLRAARRSRSNALGVDRAFVTVRVIDGIASSR